MAETINNVAKKHTVTVEYNVCVKLSGVINIISYDDKNIEVKLSDNFLVITGEKFDIVSLDLDSGNVIINGRLHSMHYVSKHEKIGFFKRLLK